MEKKSTTHNVTTEARAILQPWGQLNIFFHGILSTIAFFFFSNPVERASKLSRDQWVDIDGSRVTKLPRKHKCQERNMCVPSPFPSWALGRTNLFLCYRKLLTVAPPHFSAIPNCLAFFSPAVILNSCSENSFMRSTLKCGSQAQRGLVTTKDISEMSYVYTTLYLALQGKNQLIKGKQSISIHYSSISIFQARSSLLAVKAFCLLIIPYFSFIALIKMFFNN